MSEIRNHLLWKRVLHIFNQIPLKFDLKLDSSCSLDARLASLAITSHENICRKNLFERIESMHLLHFAHKVKHFHRCSFTTETNQTIYYATQIHASSSSRDIEKTLKRKTNDFWEFSSCLKYLQALESVSHILRNATRFMNPHECL